MALSGNTVWEVRSGGSDANGGGFVAGASGVDYSQQNAAQTAYTDLAIDSSNNTQVASAGNPFTADDVGNILCVTGGTGFTTGRYQVVSVAGGVATLDRAVGTTSSTGGTGNLGGALLSVGISASVAVLGNTVWIRGSGHVISTNTNNVANGNASWANGVRVLGYGTTRGDGGLASVSVTHTSNSVGLRVGQAFIANVAVTGTTTTGTGINADESPAWNCHVHTRGTGINCSNTGSVLVGCRAENCTTVGLSITGAAAHYCVAKSCARGIHAAGSNQAANVSHCIAISCSIAGFANSSASRIFAANCVAYACDLGFDSAGLRSTYTNCIAANCTTAGFVATTFSFLIGCAGFNNAANKSGTFVQDIGFIALTTNPFVDAAGEDFRLNDNPDGGLELVDTARPSAFPGINTPNHATIGAAGPLAFGARAGGGKLYPLGKSKLLSGAIDLAGGDIKAALVLDSYTYDDADEFLDDVDAAANGSTGNLDGKSVTAGRFDASDATCTPDVGQDVNAIVVYLDSGDPSTSPLIAYLDALDPFTTIGTEVTIAWPNGEHRIFAITELVEAA